MRQKTCKNCKIKFLPDRPLQAACSIKCAIELSKTRQKAKSIRDHKEAKERLKSRQDWIKEAQTAFNAYIRARDINDGCISCDKPANWNGQWHAGHYRTTKAAPELRFSENNVHKQCSACNNHLSGNLLEYRKNLILKIGFDMVEFLESAHPPKHYTIEDLKDIKAKYKQKLKDLKIVI